MWEYNVRDMISNHTLAQNIITGHNTPNAVLDSKELDLLIRFCLNPSSKLSLLEAEGMISYVDPDSAAAKNPKSLVGYCIARSGTENPALIDSEISMLKKWFHSLDVDICNGAGPMIKTHTLGYNLLIRPHEIFDSNAFALMHRFCMDPSTRDAILRDYDMVDDPEAKPGTRANVEKGSLAGYCVATYGTDASVLEEQEVNLLKEWFEKGGPAPVVG